MSDYSLFIECLFNDCILFIACLYKDYIKIILKEFDGGEVKNNYANRTRPFFKQ